MDLPSWEKTASCHSVVVVPPLEPETDNGETQEIRKMIIENVNDDVHFVSELQL